MPKLPPAPGLFALAAMVICVIFGSQVTGWTESDRSLELAGLTLAAMLTACLRVQQSTARDRAIMPPSFVIIFASLLLLGPDVATLVAAASALTPRFAGFSAHGRAKTIVDAVILCLATQVAGVAQRSASILGEPVWPWRALPIAAAVIGYHVAQGSLAELAGALLS